jgi:predicted RNA-binding protein with PIN domain
LAYEKHLLVDGSNVMHAWPSLRALLKRDRDAARAALSKAVRVLHDVEQWRVTVVFDGRGADLTVEHPAGAATFSHVFTPAGLTADDAIEQLVGQAASPSDVYVATDDRAERQTIEALGASPLSADELESRVRAADERQRARVAGLHRQNDQDWQRPRP